MTINSHENQGGVIPQFHIGHRMALALEHAGMGAAEMADYLGVSANTVSRWTHGKTPPKKQTIRLWALRTGVSYDWLENGKTPQQSLEGSALLPRLDSNQQPSVYQYPQVSDLSAYRSRSAHHPSCPSRHGSGECVGCRGHLAAVGA